MADWLWVESPGTTLQQQPRVREARFGDGYAQRAPDGINHQPQSWEATFNDVDDEIGDEMIAFLRAHGGYKPFSYHPRWELEPIKVICPQWRRSLGNEIGTSTITCTFEQDFAPGGFEPGAQGNARLDSMAAAGGGAGGSTASGDATIGGPSAGGGLTGNVSSLSGNAGVDGPSAGGSLQTEGLVGDAALAGPSASGSMASEEPATFDEGYLVKLTFETYTVGAAQPQINNEGVYPNILISSGLSSPDTISVETDSPLYGSKYLKCVGSTASAGVQSIFAHYPATGAGSPWQTWAANFGLQSTQTFTIGGFITGSLEEGGTYELFHYYGARATGGFFTVHAYLSTVDGASYFVVVDIVVYSDRTASPTLIESRTISGALSSFSSSYRHVEVAFGGTAVTIKAHGTQVASQTMTNALVADLGGRLHEFLGTPGETFTVKCDDWFIHRHTTPLHSGNFTPAALP